MPCRQVLVEQMEPLLRSGSAPGGKHDKAERFGDTAESVIERDEDAVARASPCPYECRRQLERVAGSQGMFSEKIPDEVAHPLNGLNFDPRTAQIGESRQSPVALAGWCGTVATYSLERARSLDGRPP